mmetsp:Transcript_8321/g.18022  ORF Transcript_8321/g.18022 Transcript_8321/m.18022 type:complete len:126 (-) Transcript_8321:1979-2356(-)
MNQGVNRRCNWVGNRRQRVRELSNFLFGRILTHTAVDTSFPEKIAKCVQEEKENVMEAVGSAIGTQPSTANIQESGKPNVPLGGRGVSSNAYANGSSQNTGNVITDRPSSRVTQPPGGKSSISFY